MPTQMRLRPHSSGTPRPNTEQSAAALLQQRSLELPSSGPLPTVRLRSVRLHPHLFRKLVDKVDPAARPGDLVAVQTPQGVLLGHGLYNPHAEIAVRMLNF